MTREEIAGYLENAAQSLLDATKNESLEIRGAALVGWGLLRLGATLERRGLEPVEHVTRLVDANPGFDAAEKDADAAADAKFAPPPPIDPGGTGTPTP